MRDQIHLLLEKCGVEMRQTGKIPSGAFVQTPLPLLRKEASDRKERVIIFDVGANIGQSVAEFEKGFDCEKIYAFEPFPETYKKLVKNTKTSPVVHCCNFAISHSDHFCEIIESAGISQKNRLASRDKDLTDQMEARSIDSFVKEKKVPGIFLLKTDTEGMELDVFKGAEATFAAGLVDWIYVEVGLTAIQDHHVFLDDVVENLDSAGFLFAGLYEVTFGKHYSYANALFRRRSLSH